MLFALVLVDCSWSGRPGGPDENLSREHWRRQQIFGVGCEETSSSRLKEAAGCVSGISVISHAPPQL